jgi:hypothetical protein
MASGGGFVHHQMVKPYEKSFNYFVYASSAKNHGEDAAERLNKNGIELKGILNVVSSKDERCDFIFMQSNTEVILCYATYDGNKCKYNLMRIYTSDTDILDITCTPDGSRVYILVKTRDVLTAANTGSAGKPAYNFVKI